MLGLLLTDGELVCDIISFTPLLGLLLIDGESVCDALVRSDNTLGFIETLGFPVLLGLKLIDGNAVGITLGFEDIIGV